MKEKKGTRESRAPFRDIRDINLPFCSIKHIFPAKIQIAGA